jgi:hypothetical protein
VSGVKVRNPEKLFLVPEKVVRIKYGLLDIDSRTKRDAYDPEIFQSLFNDIKENGFRVDKPLSVRLNPKGRGYLINCGQHRFEAGLKAGIKVFPCVVKEGQTDAEAVIEAYKDNSISGSLDAITEANLFRKIGKEILKGKRGRNAPSNRLRPVNGIGSGNAPANRLRDEIAKKTGRKPDYIKHRLVLLKLPKYVQYMVKRYYQPSLRGSKLSPTIAEEIYLIQIFIKTLNDAGIVEKTDLKEAIKYLSTKYSKEHTSLVEARKIKADIAVRGFEEWKNRIQNEGNKHFTSEETHCVLCGDNVADSPWRPFCPEHISLIEEMARDSVRNGNVPKVIKDITEAQRQRAVQKYYKFDDLVHKAYTEKDLKIPIKVQAYLNKLHREYRSLTESKGYVV